MLTFQIFDQIFMTSAPTSTNIAFYGGNFCRLVETVLFTNQRLKRNLTCLIALIVLLLIL